MRAIDISLQRFGRLTADYSFRKKDPAGRSALYWVCLCDCGNIVEVHGNSLRQGRTKSCGCLNTEARTARTTKHGSAGTKAYGAWLNMKARCTNPSHDEYKNYGGRGIRVCPRWTHSFVAFLADVGRPPSSKHSLDRYPNVNGNYEPGNVRWATSSQQARNKRNTVYLEIDGARLSLADASEQFGIAYDTLHNRIKAGWSHERAVRRFDGSIVHAERER